MFLFNSTNFPIVFIDLAAVEYFIILLKPLFKKKNILFDKLTYNTVIKTLFNSEETTNYVIFNTEINSVLFN